MRVLCNKSLSFISSKLSLHCVLKSLKVIKTIIISPISLCKDDCLQERETSLCRHLSGVKCTNTLIKKNMKHSPGIYIGDRETTKTVFIGQKDEKYIF